MTGDGELQEGQNWEALQAAAHERLGRLWVVVDRNEVQSDKPTEEIVALGDLEAKLRAFGWHVETVDGHDHAALRAAFAGFRDGGEVPKALVAMTVKGKGVSFMEHPVALAEGGGTYRWHAGAPADEPFARAVGELETRLAERCAALGLEPLALEPVEPEAPSGGLEGEPESGAGMRARPATPLREAAEYVVDAYGEALLELAPERDDLVVLDADLASDCRVRAFELAHPDRFFQCGIAEQDMVSTAAGMARHGLLPVVNSFASFLASRANEQIYNQASEGSKVVYALHYAGLIPAGPGKSHQSIRDISLLGALPNLTIVQPGSPEETRALVRWAVEEAEESVAVRLAIGPSPRRLELPGDAQAVGRGAILREGRDAVLVSYGPVMLHEALLAAERLGESGEASVRVVAMPWLNRVDEEWLESEVAAFEHVLVLEDHAPVGGLGDRLRAALPGRAIGVVRRRGVARLRVTGRGAPLPRPGRRVARHADCRPRRRPDSMSAKRPWIVLPDLLSIRVFVDTGILERARRATRRRARRGVPRAARGGGGVGRARCRRSRRSTETSSPLPPGVPTAPWARIDTWLDRRLGYHPLAIRLNHRHGFHAERMQPGHPNWMLDTDRDGPLPRWPVVERAMERWFFSPRRHVPRRLLETMRRECSGLVLSNVQPASAVPFLAAARRLGLPVVAHVASWDHTVGKGVISPHCDLYLVQNTVMEDDLRRYHGIEPERVRVTGWPQTDLFHRKRPRAEYEELVRRYGLDPGRPLVLVAGNTPSNAPYEGRFVERLVSWWERPRRRADPAPLPPAPARPAVAGAVRVRRRSRRSRRPGSELHRPRGPRDAAPARRRRRVQRGHDPPRRARGRPPGRLRALRRGGTARRVVGGEERRRGALRGARGLRRLPSGGELRRGRRRDRARARPSGRARRGAAARRRPGRGRSRRPRGRARRGRDPRGARLS